MATKLYRNPPLVEAICQFQFDPKDIEDTNALEKLLGKWKSAYPERNQGRGFSFALTPDGPLIRSDLPPRYRLTASKQASVIQVGGDFLTVNHVHMHSDPYPGWQKFKSLAVKRLVEFLNVMAVKRITVVGVRYIDKISVYETEKSPEDILCETDLVPKSFLRSRFGGLLRVELPKRGSRLMLTISFEEATPQSFLVLDTEYVWRASRKVNVDWADDKLDVAHTEIKSVFDSLISEKLMKRFGGRG